MKATRVHSGPWAYAVGYFSGFCQGSAVVGFVWAVIDHSLAGLIVSTSLLVAGVVIEEASR